MEYIEIPRWDNILFIAQILSTECDLSRPCTVTTYCFVCYIIQISYNIQEINILEYILY